MSESTYYDALVLGDGPAACVFAIEMIRRGKPVVVSRTETASRAPWPETLSPRGEFLLARIGLRDTFLGSQFPASKVLSCWRSSDPRMSTFDFEPQGRLWHIDRLEFNQSLRSRTEDAGAFVVDTTTSPLRDLLRRKGRWEILLRCAQGERLLRVRHLVDATGRSRKLGRAMGAKRILRDPLIAISCSCTQDPIAAPLLIEAVRAGWWYSFGVATGELLVALVTDPKAAHASSTARSGVWEAMLQEAPHTAARLDTARRRLRVLPAETARLDRMSGDGWVAIGDAAMTFDPLSSHGLCAAIEQGIEAAEALANRRCENAIREFESRRTMLFSRYREQRRAFYAQPTRFAESAFWKRRRTIEGYPSQRSSRPPVVPGEIAAHS